MSGLAVFVARMSFITPTGDFVLNHSDVDESIWPIVG